MGKRIEMEAEEKEYLIQECLAGQMRMRDAARRTGQAFHHTHLDQPVRVGRFGAL